MLVAPSTSTCPFSLPTPCIHTSVSLRTDASWNANIGMQKVGREDSSAICFPLKKRLLNMSF
jgi:hypothetical protein